MIRIAVVDDEKAICDELLFFLKEYEMKFKMIFDISIYYNGENLLADLEDDIHFDLILLDIELAKINGVEVGMKLSITLDTLTARILKLSSDSQSRIEPTPFYSWWEPTDCRADSAVTPVAHKISPDHRF